MNQISGKIERHDGASWLEYRSGSGNSVEILDINVANGHRREGTGREMFRELLTKLGGDNLIVYAITRWNNTVACQFYESLGFRIIARLHQFYRFRSEMGNGKSGFVNAVMFGYDV